MEFEQFTSGAKRDLSIGKPRIDLIPNELYHLLDAYNYCVDYKTLVGLHHTVNEVFIQLYKLEEYVNSVQNGIGTLKPLQNNIIELFKYFDESLYSSYSSLEYAMFKRETKNLITNITPYGKWCLGLVLADGASKYGDNNWLKGMPLNRTMQSLYRHLIQCQLYPHDEYHKGAVLFNLAALIVTLELMIKDKK